MQGAVTLELQFWVTKTDGKQEKAATLMLKDTAFGFIAPIVDMSMTIQITKLNVDSVVVVQSTFGKLSGISIKLEINNGFRIIQPTLNKMLGHKVINFPTNVFGIFELKSLTLSYYDNYLYAGLTPIFIGPSAYEALPAEHAFIN